MGILNITPDSFSDAGELLKNGRPDLELIVDRAHQMLEQGADILDIGGESTRPGADAISINEEIERVAPVIEKLSELPVIISVDTNKPEVMRAAIDAGAHIINDVKALRADGALELIADSEVGVCLMHMQGTPKNMQQTPSYNNVSEQVKGFLAQRVELCEARGICKTRLMIDPGFGFGKTFTHNLTLLRELSQLNALKLPILAGVSRKSMVAQLINSTAMVAVEQRVNMSVLLALVALQNGARILRVHDVKQHVEAVKLFNTLDQAAVLVQQKDINR